jgi:hypothetical protein
MAVGSDLNAAALQQKQKWSQGESNNFLHANSCTQKKKRAIDGSCWEISRF